MALREGLLNPISAENPGGIDVRYDSKLLIYDKIKEARREDDGLNQGEWQQERKVADLPFILKTTQEALATKTKDLQLAAWLCDALLRTEGFGGLQQGLALCKGLIANFWEPPFLPTETAHLEFPAPRLHG